LMAASVAVAAAGFLLARRFFGGERGLAGGEAWAARFPALHRLLVNKYWVDEIYDATVVAGTWGSARGLFAFDSRFIDGVLVNGSRHLTVAISLLSGFFDKYFVDGAVNLVGTAMRALSRAFRALQTGLVSQYGLALVLGLAVLLAWYVAMRMGGW
ncbi:MAG: NADH-quinone oxidoreductase subunit L, partial [Thermoanaerobaculia bacterium]